MSGLSSRAELCTAKEASIAVPGRGAPRWVKAYLSYNVYVPASTFLSLLLTWKRVLLVRVTDGGN